MAFSNQTAASCFKATHFFDSPPLQVLLCYNIRLLLSIYYMYSQLTASPQTAIYALTGHMKRDLQYSFPVICHVLSVSLTDVKTFCKYCSLFTGDVCFPPVTTVPVGYWHCGKFPVFWADNYSWTLASHLTCCRSLSFISVRFHT